MLIVQTILICILLTAIVKIAVGNDAVNGAYFYPKEIQQRLIELGRTDQKTIDRKRKLCMTSFYVVLPVAMLLIIGWWNGVSDFRTAYLQALLFLEVTSSGWDAVNSGRFPERRTCLLYRAGVRCSKNVVF